MSTSASRPPSELRRERTWLVVFGLWGGFLAAFALGVSVLTLAATGFDDASPAVASSGADTLLTGERIYVTNCSRCHGASGEGGIGLKLGGGAVVEKYPDIADQIELINNGKGTMPGFSTTLSAAEIDAVARYEREQLTG